MEDKIDRLFNLRLADMYIELGEEYLDRPYYFTVANGFLYDARSECKDAAELDGIAELNVRLQEAMIRSKLNGDDVEARVSLDEERIIGPIKRVKK